MRTIRAIAILVLLALSAAATPARAEEGPGAGVARLHVTLLEVMREAKALGFEGRYRRLDPVLTEVFNFAVMARISVGRHWKKLSTAERGRLVDAFTRMSVATFAARFDGYSGERFEVDSEKETARGGVMVNTQLVSPKNGPIALNYLARKYDGKWRVIDVSLDSKYSELARQRAEYSAVIGRAGLDGLLKAIEGKIAALADGKG